MKCSKLCAAKAINGIIDLNCAGTASISNASNVGLHELVDSAPVIILHASYCNIEMNQQWTPEYDSILHYWMEMCKIDHFKCDNITS